MHRNSSTLVMNNTEMFYLTVFILFIFLMDFHGNIFQFYALEIYIYFKM